MGFDKEDRSVYTEPWMIECCKSYLSSPKYIMENLYVFDWESDLLLYTNSGYFYEFEVKISLQDFKKDFSKKKKHQILETGFVDVESIKRGETKIEQVAKKRPNYFLYAVPHYLVDKVTGLVPEHAGLISIKEGWGLKVEKKPKKLHSEKLDLNLQDKFYYNWRKYRDKLWDNNEIKLLQEENKRLKYEIGVIKEEYKIAAGHPFEENL